MFQVGVLFFFYSYFFYILFFISIFRIVYLGSRLSLNRIRMVKTIQKARIQPKNQIDTATATQTCCKLFFMLFRLI